MFRSVNVLMLVALVGACGVSQETGAQDHGFPPGVGPEGGMQIEVPHNEILVMSPMDDDKLPLADLDVQIQSGYGVLTFISIMVNGKVAVEMENIEARSLGAVTVPKDSLSIGKNVLKVNSWHQLPNTENRLEKYSAPPITFKVLKPKK